MAGDADAVSLPFEPSTSFGSSLKCEWGIFSWCDFLSSSTCFLPGSNFMVLARSRLASGGGMTIAMCYLSPEGVVLGADSTTTASLPDGNHYLNNNQKLFEVGESSTIGALTWGAASIGTKSHRTLFANLSDRIQQNNVNSVENVATEFAKLVWDEYKLVYSAEIDECKQLNVKDAAGRKRCAELVGNTYTGFCIAGHIPPDRASAAYEITFDVSKGKPSPVRLQPEKLMCWGAPNLIKRLLFGCADEIFSDIIGSGKWTGTDVELAALVLQHRLCHGILPIRDAIDFVYTCIYSTIKAMKFSSFPQVCGGPIELAVITSDRKFRWVKHKPWDVAINEGGL